MELEEVDPRDDVAFADWFGVVDASLRAARPGEVDHLPGDLRAAALDGRPGDDGSPPPDEQQHLLLVRDAGEPLGAARVELPMADNRHTVGALVHVRPEHRRRGVGSTLLKAVEEHGRRHQRTTLMVELDEPPHLQGRSPGRTALERAGLRQVLLEVRRDLALPVDPSHLDALDAACAPHAAGYLVRTWGGHCPDDLVDDRAALGRAISTDAPLGGLEWEEEEWDAARVRRREEQVAAMGRTCLAAGAVHEETGTMVAFTELAAPAEGEGLVHQWETVVLRDHRGHRLGTLVKTAALRRLARELPQARTIVTCNADSNRPMIAVNESLGYRPNGTLTAWQRTL